MFAPPAVTDAELALLEHLWAVAPQTARQLADQVYPPGAPADTASPSDVATVQKLLQRLEAKRLVSRDRSGRVHGFAPLLGRDAYASARLTQLAARLSDGSVAPLLMHLVNTQQLSANDLAELRRVLDAAPTPPPETERSSHD